MSANDIGIAVATHSDEHEYNHTTDVKPDTHILGTELVQALLRHSCRSEDVSTNDILIIAYNPRVRHANDDDDDDDTNQYKYKRYHMRRIQEHFGVQGPQILFLDDTPEIVQDCKEYCGVHAVQVDAQRGLQWSDILQLQQTVKKES
jgi:hypothetical protein